MAKDIREDELLELLRAIPAFDAIEPPVLEQMVELAEYRNVALGEALIREGDQANTLYIVLKGRFTVLAGALPIAEIRPGEPIGELAFFAGGLRTATVIAARDSSVMALTRESYDALSARTPALANGILAAVSRRLARAVPAAPGLLPQAGRVCAVLPGAGQVLDRRFVEQLTAAFDVDQSWRILDETFAPPDLLDDPERLSDWLEEQEVAHGTLLLICRDPDAHRTWRKTIASNSDTIVIAVARTDQFDPERHAPSPLEIQVYQAKMETNVQLVLYRPNASDSTCRTSDWLHDRLTGLHHHVALDRPDDFARVGRFIRGEAVGLVLCGGGSFGTAHLGAIKYLLERGYHFDFVGGTSVGSALGAALAMQISPEEIMDQCEDIFIKSKAMSKLTVPRHALLDHHTLDAAFVRHYGAFDVEDLPLNFYAVATSLTFNDLSVIRTGPLWQAIRASTAIPGIFPPMLCADGEVLIDGSLIDNVPLDVMRGFKPGPNIVLNFLPDRAWRVAAKYEDLPNRAQALGSLVRGPRKGTPRHPSAFAILARAMVVNARRLLTQINVGEDVLLNLSLLRGMSFMDWKRGRELFDTAYAQMEAAMAEVDDADLSTQDGRMALLREASDHINDVGKRLGLTTR
ncbi:MAG: patatin-like phospholipase family protein [Pseudomonadota bacterium]